MSLRNLFFLCIYSISFIVPIYGSFVEEISGLLHGANRIEAERILSYCEEWKDRDNIDPVVIKRFITYCVDRYPSYATMIEDIIVFNSTQHIGKNMAEIAALTEARTIPEALFLIISQAGPLAVGSAEPADVFASVGGGKQALSVTDLRMQIKNQPRHKKFDMDAYNNVMRAVDGHALTLTEIGNDNLIMTYVLLKQDRLDIFNKLLQKVYDALSKPTHKKWSMNHTLSYSDIQSFFESEGCWLSDEQYRQLQQKKQAYFTKYYRKRVLSIFEESLICYLIKSIRRDILCIDGDIEDFATFYCSRFETEFKIALSVKKGVLADQAIHKLEQKGFMKKAEQLKQSLASQTLESLTTVFGAGLPNEKGKDFTAWYFFFNFLYMNYIILDDISFAESLLLLSTSNARGLFCLAILGEEDRTDHHNVLLFKNIFTGKEYQKRLYKEFDKAICDFKNQQFVLFEEQQERDKLIDSAQSGFKALLRLQKVALKKMHTSLQPVEDVASQQSVEAIVAEESVEPWMKHNQDYYKLYEMVQQRYAALRSHDEDVAEAAVSAPLRHVESFNTPEPEQSFGKALRRFRQKCARLFRMQDRAYKTLLETERETLLHIVQAAVAGRQGIALRERLSHEQWWKNNAFYYQLYEAKQKKNKETVESAVAASTKTAPILKFFKSKNRTIVPCNAVAEETPRVVAVSDSRGEAAEVVPDDTREMALLDSPGKHNSTSVTSEPTVPFLAPQTHERVQSILCPSAEEVAGSPFDSLHGIWSFFMPYTNHFLQLDALYCWPFSMEDMAAMAQSVAYEEAAAAVEPHAGYRNNTTIRTDFTPSGLTSESYNLRVHDAWKNRALKHNLVALGISTHIYMNAQKDVEDQIFRSEERTLRAAFKQPNELYNTLRQEIMAARMARDQQTVSYNELLEEHLKLYITASSMGRFQFPSERFVDQSEWLMHVQYRAAQYVAPFLPSVCLVPVSIPD